MARTIVGITGGIGSGKSEVTAYLRRLGYTVICADEVSREIAMPGEPGHAAIRETMGGRFFRSDGTLDRKKLAAYVFADEERVVQLNALLHPLVVARIFALARGCSGIVFIDAALLIQTHMHEKVDAVWVITADKDLRIRRVVRRDECTEEDVRQRIDKQMSDHDMIAYADAVIDNSSTRKALHMQVDKLLSKMKYAEDALMARRRKKADSPIKRKWWTIICLVAVCAQRPYFYALRSYYRVYPLAYETEIATWSAEYAIDEYLVCAVIHAESGF